MKLFQAPFCFLFCLGHCFLFAKTSCFLAGQVSMWVSQGCLSDIGGICPSEGEGKLCLQAGGGGCAAWRLGWMHSPTVLLRDLFSSLQQMWPLPASPELLSSATSGIQAGGQRSQLSVRCQLFFSTWSPGTVTNHIRPWNNLRLSYLLSMRSVAGTQTNPKLPQHSNIRIVQFSCEMCH